MRKAEKIIKKIGGDERIAVEFIGLVIGGAPPRGRLSVKDAIKNIAEKIGVEPIDVQISLERFRDTKQQQTPSIFS